MTGALPTKVVISLTPRRLIPLVLASLTLAIAGCGKPPGKEVPVTPVLVMTVGGDQTATLRTLPGVVTPRYAANVGFQVAGRVQKRMVEVGSRVRQGQALAVLNAADYSQGVLAAQDQVAAALADREQSLADAKRFKTLADRGMISQAGLGTQQARADAAQARLDQAQRQLELARNRMAYTTLVAPFDGLVTALHAEVGQVVAEGMPVASVAKDDTLEVTVETPEDMRLHEAAPETRFDGRLTGQASPPLKLKLREVAPATTAPLRTFRAAFTILNAKSVEGGLRIGQSAEVSLAHALKHRAGVQLPAAAVISNGQDVAVWRVDAESNSLRRHVVTVKGTTNDGVLVDGLEPGQRIVIAGTDKLGAGQPVRPIERSGTGYAVTTP